MAIAASENDVEQATFGCPEAHLNPDRQFHRPSIDDFEDLYLAYRPRVWALCLRMTGNPDEAEDLTQETFLRTFQKLDTFRGESDFCTWLRRITINVTLLRFQKASWRRETPLEETSGPDNMTGCPHKTEFGKMDAQMSEAADRVSLERAMDQLPPGFKAVLILHDIEGYAHVEISELMGCSVGTSKSQLHKARLKMRNLLGVAAAEPSAPRTSEPKAQAPEQEGGNPATWLVPFTGTPRCRYLPAEAA